MNSPAAPHSVRTGLFQFPLMIPRRYLVGTLWITALATGIVALDSFGLALIGPLVDLILGNPVETEGTGMDWLWRAVEWSGLPLTVGALAMAIIIAQVFRSGGLVAQQWFTALLQARYGAMRKQQTFSALMNAEWSFFVRSRSGDHVNTLTVEGRRTGYALAAFTDTVSAAINTLLYLATAVVISWQLSLAALGYTIVVTAGLAVFVMFARRIGETFTRVDSELLSTSNETLGSMKLVKASGYELERSSVFRRAAMQVARIETLNGLNQGGMRSMTELLFISAMVGGLILAHNSLGVPESQLTVFALLFYRIFQRARAFQSGLQGLNRVLPSLDVVRRTIAGARAEAEPSTGADIESIESGVTLENVSFAYDSTTRPVLSNVCLSIPRGTVVAVTGESGAGKTTLVDLVIGLLRPTDGMVLVDARPLAEINPRSWRRRIAYVSQETILMHDTVAANIAWGLGVPDMEAVREAAATAQADQFISAMPEGYETVIGDRGVRLSGGQRRRLALARAIYRRPELLILDEATSDLDFDTERRVQEAIKSLSGQVTMLIVAHRISTIMDADDIYVLSDGRVTEHGTPTELMHNRGLFYHLATSSQLEVEGRGQDLVNRNDDGQ